jgi:hypothetical protein
MRLGTAAWTARSLIAARRQIRGPRPTEPLRLPSAAILPVEDLAAVRAALRLTGTKCLTRALIEQAWRADHGDPRDVVIGVTSPREGMRAHAWLDGLEDGSAQGFSELARVRPRQLGTFAQSRENRVLVLAHALALDRVVAEATEALEAAGAGVVLIKGPSIAKWLYDPGELRPYGDVDLLVDPAHVGTAREVLRSLGFAPKSIGMSDDPSILSLHDEWVRDGRRIDLNRTLDEVDAAPSRVWSVLRDHLDTMPIGGRDVTVLAPPARLLSVVLHAAHHRFEFPRVLEDLDRALTRVPAETWRDAWRLAGELQAQAAFRRGLLLIERGRALADALGPPAGDPFIAEWSAARQPPVALGLYRLARTRGLTPKLRLLAREVVPSPAFMRWSSPLAQRGRAGLALAYAVRPLRLAARLPVALIEYRRLRSAARRPPGQPS